MNVCRKKFRIAGMECVKCQERIENALKNWPGVLKVSVSFRKGFADISYDSDITALSDICREIQNLGYEVLQENECVAEKNSCLKDGVKPCGRFNVRSFFRTLTLVLIIVLIFILLDWSGILNFLVPGKLADTKTGYGMMIVLGLFTSVHCIAMCGGINLSQCLVKTGCTNSRTNNGRKNTSALKPALLYNLGRVLSYTATGFLLGLLGLCIGSGLGTGVSYVVQGILKIIAGFFMITAGCSMLGIFPSLRRFSFSLPKSLGEKIGRKKSECRMPFFVGVLNGFMPCGPLQSMQLVALACANPFEGAFAMFLFALGTVPLMLGFGSFVSLMGKKFSKKILCAGAVLVTVLGLTMIVQGGHLAGFTLPKVFANEKTAEKDSAQTELSENIQNIQIIKSSLLPGRYPDITVKAGIPVKWIINAPQGSINGCNYRMFVKQYNIIHTFKEGENIIEFTPKKAGVVQCFCWMGMIRGSILIKE
ncbi:MAG: sulfite exporter TauE/SafE family protein [Treponema sp.]